MGIIKLSREIKASLESIVQTESYGVLLSIRQLKKKMNMTTVIEAVPYSFLTI